MTPVDARRKHLIALARATRNASRSSGAPDVRIGPPDELDRLPHGWGALFGRAIYRIAGSE